MFKLLRIVLIPIATIALLQSFCYYLFWVSGASWEETPRVLMAMTCGFALAIGCLFSFFYISTELDKS